MCNTLFFISRKHNGIFLSGFSSKTFSPLISLFRWFTLYMLNDNNKGNILCQMYLCGERVEIKGFIYIYVNRQFGVVTGTIILAFVENICD